MKSRETKQKDLTALQESLQNSKSAVVVTFNGLRVSKDQEFRNSLREAGAKYEVVKNTLARIAVKGTQFEGATEHFKGVTAIAWTQDDPVVLTKTISKFLKDNPDVYKYKTGVLDGKVIDFKDLQAIASLPSKEEIMSKLLYVINSSAQNLVTVINAVPRNLAVVIKLIGDAKPAEAPSPAANAQPAEAGPASEEEAGGEAAASEESAAPIEAAPATEEAVEPSAEAAAQPLPTGNDTAAEEAPGAEAAGEAPAEQVKAEHDASPEVVEESAPAPVESSTEAESEASAAAPDDAAAEVVGETPVEPEAPGEGEPAE